MNDLKNENKRKIIMLTKKTKNEKLF